MYFLCFRMSSDVSLCIFCKVSKRITLCSARCLKLISYSDKSRSMANTKLDSFLYPSNLICRSFYYCVKESVSSMMSNGNYYWEYWSYIGDYWNVWRYVSVIGQNWGDGKRDYNVEMIWDWGVVNDMILYYGIW